MNRNYEKQAELFNERLNETASLASRKPQKKQKLTRLNSLTGRARGSLSSRRSVSGMTGNFPEAETSFSDKYRQFQKQRPNQSEAQQVRFSAKQN